MGMTLSQLVFRSIAKNIKHYYLYFFALIFSVTLYFSFVTLQYNDTVLATTKESGSASAGFSAATYMLYFIILFFVLYANHLFMKRRSKEIGMYQLIGMTKGLIIRLIAFENILLFSGAVLIGMAGGFLSSRLFAMVLLKVLEQDAVVAMTFSLEAVKQSLFVFAILLVIILMQMVWMIYRVSLLSLFTASKQADERVKRFSPVQMMVGAMGLALIIYGYYASTQLFIIDMESNLFLKMIIILATTIGGTFLVFRFSVSFVMNLVRLKKNGHLTPVDVLAVTPIMHRMKGNAKSLTLITVLTAVSLAITTLSYITYYSAGETAKSLSPTDYTLYGDNGDAFLTALADEGIDFKQATYKLKTVSMTSGDLFSDSTFMSKFSNDVLDIPVIALSDYQQLVPNYALADNEAVFTNYNHATSRLMPLKSGHEISLHAGTDTYRLHIGGIREDYVLGGLISDGSPVMVVQDDLFKAIVSPSEDLVWDTQHAVTILDHSDIKRTEQLYRETKAYHNEFYIEDENGAQQLNTRNQVSYEQERVSLIQSLGVTIFTTAFLGLAFLLATCSILYFKQMSEAEEEREAYTILRKIGFTQQEILRGIYAKQAFNFGVPLVIGLLHSYFAVKSGWFLFGTELVVPLVVTMGLYIVMYIVFAALAVNYYKKVIRESL